MNTPKDDVPEVKKQITKGEGITAIIVLIIFVLVAWQAISTTPKNDNVVPPPVVAQPEQHSDTEVFVDAQGVILKALKSPSTAKFPSSSHATIVRGKDDVFKVDSYVDSQNGFGAMIRSEWSVLFQYVGDDKLTVYAISIDGETVYKKTDVEASQ
ncbi:MAG: hypothetical protein AAB921_04195 [Patescibacteria group bacterium]